MRLRYWSAALAMVLVAGSQALAADGDKKVASFGTLEGLNAEAARAQTLAWFKNAVNNDATKLQQFEALWRQTDKSVLDRVADSLTLGDAAAARLLAEARNPLLPAPTAVPDILKDAKTPVFYRANLGLAYARALTGRRVYDESLEVLKSFTPEQVVDPSAYLFHRAVCEHAMLQKADATKTVSRLHADAIDSPERYKVVGALILLDMQTWKEKDLGAVARKMHVIEDRLGISRGGPKTQQIQKDVIARLDELIKELENKAKQQQSQPGEPKPGEPKGGDPSCPDGGQPGDGQQPGPGGQAQKQPMPDSRIATNGGSGRTDVAKLRKMEEGWGKMDARQRADAMQQLEDLTRGLSPAHQEAFRNYFRNLATPAPGKQ